MPRSNRPRHRGRPGTPAEQPGLSASISAWGYERAADGEWHVRGVTGAAATKPYRCPGCDQLIPVGTPHVVVWSGDDLLGADAALGSRRHWHRACWNARGRRRPR